MKHHINLEKIHFLPLGIALCALMLALPTPEGMSANGWRVIAVAVLMLTWWISEVVPLAATALLPIVLFPLMGVMDIGKATASFSNPIVFLYMGGFAIAVAMERWHLHQRIALTIVKRIGTKANQMILGFMCATAFISMWMSNTATTVMMLPIAMSVLNLIMQKGVKPEQEKHYRNFAVAMVLGIAYGATIGGTATLIGTPPNAIFTGFVYEKYGYTVNFGDWFILGTVFAFPLLLLTWWFNTHIVFPNHLGVIPGAEKIIKSEYKKLGKMNRGEKTIAWIFFSAAIAWIVKDFLPIPKVHDTVVSIAAMVLVFIIPVDWKNRKFLLEWEDTRRLPWGILLLFGGGLTLASAMEQNGLIELVGKQLSAVSAYGHVSMVFLVAAAIMFMTEFMSNMALITVMLPVLAVLAQQFNVNPLLLMIPATFASSCAFMFPMGTPPNAIVFASGHLKMVDMMRSGFIINLIALVLVTVLAFTLMPVLFDIDLTTMPEWAKK